MAIGPTVAAPIFYTPMPMPRSPDVPRFRGRQIIEFLSKYESLADAALFTEAQKCDFLTTYCTEKEVRFISMLDGFENPNWVLLKKDLLDFYGVDEEPLFCLKDLHKFVEKGRKMKTFDHLDRYLCKFEAISKSLEAQGALTVIDRDDLFYRGFPSKFRRELKYELRAQGLWSDLTRPPRMNDVVAVAQELLRGDLYDVDFTVKSERRPCSRKDSDDEPVDDLADRGSDSASLCQMADSTDLELVAKRYEAQHLEGSVPHEEALPPRRHIPALQEWVDDESRKTMLMHVAYPSCDVPESKLCEVPAVPLVLVGVEVEVEVRSAALPTELSHVCTEPIVVPTHYESGSGFSTKNLEASDCDQLGSRVEVPELEAKELRPIGLERISDPPVCEVTLAPQTSDWAETAHTCSSKARLPQPTEVIARADKKEPNDLSATTLNSRPFWPAPGLGIYSGSGMATIRYDSQRSYGGQ
ncbi:uncharacterized protein EI90DRAFT_3125909 [Cantharellus anzutake]|uniref:uncharacterized protein n=1 Tax=Cantharellus anzutake TaxID=1750568 RepID=UPI0019075241|nr:uncharacterized protein EI90DRAFT_3125909 [Cantharellus anzutake]KAF8328514.1 hypothetical protein EI90DRAFT_3125909 [Cantharellus anzutake]